MYSAVERYFDDFLGHCLLVATASGTGTSWVSNVTGTNATPTVLGVTNSNQGEIKLLLDNTSTAETAHLYHGDICTFKADNLQTFTTRVKTGANIAANETFVFGLTTAKNTNPDNTTVNFQFKLDGNTTVVLETDDGTTDNDDKSADGATLGTSYKEFMIDFRQGLSDIRFYAVDGSGKLRRVGKGTTFNAAQATGTYVQPNFQVAKASGTTTPSASVDYCEILYKRS